jgi:hypothetical protein
VQSFGAAPMIAVMCVYSPAMATLIPVLTSNDLPRSEKGDIVFSVLAMHAVTRVVRGQP